MLGLLDCSVHGLISIMVSPVNSFMSGVKSNVDLFSQMEHIFLGAISNCTSQRLTSFVSSGKTRKDTALHEPSAVSFYIKCSSNNEGICTCMVGFLPPLRGGKFSVCLSKRVLSSVELF